MAAFLLLHGYPFDATMWEGVARALLAADPKARVVAPDLPGFGKVPPPKGAPSLDALADAAVDTLVRAGIDRAVAAGMSMGGYVALALAERRGEAVAALALVNSKAEADSDEARSARRAMIERVRAEGPDVAAEALLPRLFAPGREADPALRRHPVEGAKKCGVEGITYALEAMARRGDRTAVLERLAARGVPTTVIHGEADALMPASAARALAERVGAVYVGIEAVGHASPLEAPDAVARALLALAARAAD